MKWNPDDPPRYGGLKIDGVPPFKTAIEFEFDPEVNVFIGPNATGKSTILKLLCQRFPHNVDRKRFAVEWTGRDRPPQVYLPPVRDVAPGDPSKYGRIGPEDVSDDFLQGLIYLAVIMSVSDPQDDWLSGDPEGWDFDWVMLVVQEFIDLARHGLGPINITDEKGFLEWLLDGFSGYNADDLRDRALAALRKEEFVREARRQLEEVEGGRFLLNGADPHTSFPAVRVKLALDRLREDARARWAQVINVAADCCYDICPEVFTGEVDAWRVVERSGSLVVSETSHPGEGFGVRGAAGDAIVYIGQLSTGTQGLWWWICWLALRLVDEDYRGRSFQQPAILLIDEIENHLHPTWQRRVIPALRKHFPGLQIFATTHSPFVVAGLKRGQVHRLYREKGVIKTDQLTEEEKEHKLVGWTVEEILRKFMDVDDPTDEVTAEAAAALRWLRGRYPSDGDVTAVQWVQECLQQLRDNPERTRDEVAALGRLTEQQKELTKQQKEEDEGAVEWRRRVLGELRAQVSVDMEAGGPFAAQRELFIEQLRDLLGDDEEDEDDETDSQDPDEED